MSQQVLLICLVCVFSWFLRFCQLLSDQGNCLVSLDCYCVLWCIYRSLHTEPCGMNSSLAKQFSVHVHVDKFQMAVILKKFLASMGNYIELDSPQTDRVQWKKMNCPLIFSLVSMHSLTSGTSVCCDIKFSQEAVFKHRMLAVLTLQCRSSSW